LIEATQVLTTNRKLLIFPPKDHYDIEVELELIMANWDHCCVCGTPPVRMAPTELGGVMYLCQADAEVYDSTSLETFCAQHPQCNSPADGES